MRRALSRVRQAAILAVVAAADPAAASYFDLQTSVAPAAPSSYETTIATASGGSTDGCVPQLGAIVRDGTAIVVQLWRSTLACTQSFTSWKVDASLGYLHGGRYTVHFDLFTFPFGNSGSLDSITFDVASDFGGDVYDADVRKVVCTNRTTGERVAVRNPALPLNCEAYGLTVAPGDEVGFRIVGTKASGAGEP